MFRPTLRCSKSSNHASLPTAEEPAPPPLNGKPPAAEHRLQGVSCSVLREEAGFGTAGKTDASVYEPDCRKGKAGRNRSALRAGRKRAPGRAAGRTGPGGRKDWAGGAETHPGPDEAGPAEQKRAPGRQIRTAPRPSGLFHAADQPQGVSAAESPRRRRRTRRSGTPRGPAPSGRGSRRRWPRCRVRPAGRRFGRRFRPDCAAAAARRPAA